LLRFRSIELARNSAILFAGAHLILRGSGSIPRKNLALAPREKN
jgi:hypothetical protein